MVFSEALLLSFVQGITEFLPVSSSAHLALLPQIVGFDDQGLAADVAAHVGSLFAVLFFFRHKIFAIIRSFLPHANDAHSRSLGFKIALSFTPILVFGIAKIIFDFDMPRSIGTIAAMTIIFGILMFIADRFASKNRNTIGFADAFIAGCGQVLALVPGVSRSGITMTMLRSRGIDRSSAVEFAFLMSIPAISAAGLWAFIEYINAPVVSTSPGSLGLLVAMSFVFSLVAIRFMLKFVGKFSLAAFAIYRVGLGLILLAF